MEIKGPYRINGAEHSHESLAKHCRNVINDPGAPEWYRKIFSFIGQFLDDTTDPILQMTSGTTGDPGEHVRVGFEYSSHDSSSRSGSEPV